MSTLIFAYLIVAAISYVSMTDDSKKFDVKVALNALCWPVAAVMLYIGHIKKKAGRND